MNRRKFIQSLLISAGCLALPINLVKANPVDYEFIEQYFVSYLYLPYEIDSNNNLIKLSLKHLQNYYNTNYKSSEYRSILPKIKSTNIPKHEKVSFYKYNNLYVRFAEKLYDVSTDEYINRFDIFIGKRRT